MYIGAYKAWCWCYHQAKEWHLPQSRKSYMKQKLDVNVGLTVLHTV